MDLILGLYRVLGRGCTHGKGIAIVALANHAALRGRALYLAPESSRDEPFSKYLAELGFVVTRCLAASDMAHLIADETPVLIVVNVPTLLDTLDTCGVVRAMSQAPLLVIGHQDVESDEVLSLEYGADAYLPPQATARRVRAYVHALLRRSRLELEAASDAPLRCGPLTIDLSRHRVFRNDLEIELSHKEFALLHVLVEHAGHTVTRQDLAGSVWGRSEAGDSRSLDVHIHWLREKLEDDSANPQHIRTVRGIGYSFEP